MIFHLNSVGIKVLIIPAIEEGYLFLTLEMKLAALEEFAEKIHYHVKLLEVDAKLPYVSNQNVKSMFEPFRRKDFIFLIKKIYDFIPNKHYLEKHKIIVDAFPLHDIYGINEVKKVWQSEVQDSYQCHFQS